MRGSSCTTMSAWASAASSPQGGNLDDRQLQRNGYHTGILLLKSSPPHRCPVHQGCQLAQELEVLAVNGPTAVKQTSSLNKSASGIGATLPCIAPVQRMIGRQLSTLQQAAHQHAHYKGPATAWKSPEGSEAADGLGSAWSAINNSMQVAGKAVGGGSHLLRHHRNGPCRLARSTFAVQTSGRLQLVCISLRVSRRAADLSPGWLVEAPDSLAEASPACKQPHQR